MLLRMTDHGASASNCSAGLSLRDCGDQNESEERSKHGRCIPKTSFDTYKDVLGVVGRTRKRACDHSTNLVQIGLFHDKVKTLEFRHSSVACNKEVREGMAVWRVSFGLAREHERRGLTAMNPCFESKPPSPRTQVLFCQQTDPTRSL